MRSWRTWLLAWCLLVGAGQILAAVSIVRQPADTWAPYGGEIILQVELSDPTYTGFVWKKDGAVVKTGGNGSPYFGVLSATAADAGSYSVTFTGSFGSITSRTAVVTVDAIIPPRILTPPKTVVVTTDLPFALGANIVGTLPITCRWAKNGVPFTNTTLTRGTSDSFQIYPPSVSDSGQYTLTVTNAAGTVTSPPTVVTFVTHQLPAITRHPRTQNVVPGQVLDLIASATGGELTYQWTKDGVPIPSATTEGYGVNHATSSDAGVYRVTATNASGSVTSEAANVTIGTQAGYYINIQPYSRSLYVMYPGTIDSRINGEVGSPLHITRWYRNGALFLASGSDLALGTLGYEDVGSYRFDVVFLDSSLKPTGTPLVSETFRIDLSFSPTGPIFKSGLFDKQVMEGSTVRWIPNVNGKGAVTYQWRRNGLPIPGATSATYGMANVVPSDSGIYDLLATDSVGSAATQPSTLYVAPLSSGSTLPLVAPPQFVRQSQSQAVLRGSVVALTALAAPTGSCTYTWLKNGIPSFFAGSSDANGEPGITILQFSDGDVATYTCVASNSEGSVTSAPMVLSIAQPPQANAPSLSQQPTSQTAVAGANISFSVIAGGTSPLSYQWRKGGVAISGATDSTLTLFNVGLAASGTYDVVVSNSAGSAISSGAVLTVTAPPLTITSQPVSRSASVGETVTLSAAATLSGGGSISYQWRRNGINLAGATNASLTLANLAAGDFGNYTVLISYDGGSILSQVAQLGRTSATPAAPAITRQPLGATLRTGGTLGLNVEASGTPDPTYQWRRNNTDIPGATAAALLSPNAPAGDYTVVVSNASGSVTSATATVALTNGFGRQINVSTRGFVGTGEAILITGFVVSGSTAKDLLIRSVGPTLGTYGVDNALANPILELYDAHSHLVQSNDNWSDDAANATAVRNRGLDAGAFDLPTGSKDAALVVTLNPGSYSIKTAGVGNTTGVALAEVYDLSASDPAAGRLVNLSTRNFIGTGSAKLIVGFVVQGSVAKTVMARAVGPTLQNYGVGGAIARPELSIFDSTNHLMASNVAWESSGISESMMSISSVVGAFDLPRGSADCCLVTVLPPGVYSAVVSGTNGTTGVGLVEIYEAP